MENPVILQTFYWEMNSNKNADKFSEEADLWNLLAERADLITEAGFDYLWFPTANKGAGGVEDVGYGTYDLWDLGEFKQKGSIRTKYGTKEQLENAVKELHNNGLKLIYDAVLNHRLGADIDYDNQEIKEEVIRWGNWIVNEIDFDGFRLDASTHIDNEMIYDFIEEVNESTEKDLIFIGEAWVNSPGSLIECLNIIGHNSLSVFDFPLRQSFVEMMKGNLDMRWFGGRGLVNQKNYKNRAITFVENHDTDHDSTNKYGIETIVYRKMQAYTYILMRRDGLPIVFWKDYYNYGLKENIDKLITARKKFAYGDAYESEKNDKNTYSYIRTGDEKHPGSGMIMMITQYENKELIEKTINTGKADTLYYDFTANVKEKVKTDSDGNGIFKVRGTAKEGYSVWVQM